MTCSGLMLVNLLSLTKRPACMLIWLLEQVTRNMCSFFLKFFFRFIILIHSIFHWSTVDRQFLIPARNTKALYSFFFYCHSFFLKQIGRFALFELFLLQTYSTVYCIVTVHTSQVFNTRCYILPANIHIIWFDCVLSRTPYFT